MRIRLLLAAAAGLTLAACSESSTAPHRISPANKSAADMITDCRSGYHIATRADGTQYCESDSPEATSPSSAVATDP